MTRSTQGPKGIFGAVLAGSVSLIAMAAPAWGQSLEDTLIMAYNSNPTLQAERANLRAIDEGRVQAMAGRLPED